MAKFDEVFYKLLALPSFALSNFCIQTWGNVSAKRDSVHYDEIIAQINVFIDDLDKSYLRRVKKLKKR